MNRAQVEALLVGVRLPASKDELVRYARAQPAGARAAARLQSIPGRRAPRAGPRAAARLQSIPDRRYTAIQDAGEELEPVQPERRTQRIEPPKPESGRPPGGPASAGAPTEPPNVEALRRG